MPNQTAPPPVISCARVLEYASVDDSVAYTGRQRLYVGEKLLGAVPHLAICKNLVPEEGVLILHCDKNWNSVGASGSDSIEEAKAHLERAYAGLGSKWMQSNYTDADVQKFLEKEWGETRCCICGKWPFEIERLIQGKTGYVCSECITQLHQQLTNSDGKV